MKNIFANLSSLGIIKISGDDARSFLQAQFTCDMNMNNPGYARPGAWCNPKGRVIANFLILSNNDSYLLLLPTELINKVCQRLQMFVLRSKVEIQNPGDTYGCYGLYIDDPDAFISREIPANIIAAQLPGAIPGRIILAGPVDALDALASTFPQTGINAAGLADWEALDIEAGIPWILADTSEQVLPQELNLDRLDGLSYNKGCYPGQEIVARLHFRGQLKRRLYGGYIDSDTANPQPGAKLSREGDSNTSGIIINSIRKSAKTVRSLAVLNIEDAASTQLHTPEGDIFHPFTATEESSTD
ncbi:MAG: hypothetical protein WD709_05760 [Gammaproteobacteria bacterium]